MQLQNSQKIIQYTHALLMNTNTIATRREQNRIDSPSAPSPSPPSPRHTHTPRQRETSSSISDYRSAERAPVPAHSETIPPGRKIRGGAMARCRPIRFPRRCTCPVKSFRVNASRRRPWSRSRRPGGHVMGFRCEERHTWAAGQRLNCGNNGKSLVQASEPHLEPRGERWVGYARMSTP